MEVIRTTKWFIVDDSRQVFKSRCKADNTSTAFEKSIEAWELREMGYYAYDSITTCGLCDVFKYTKTQCCIDCPITKYCQGVVFCRDNKPYLDYQEAMDQESEQKAQPSWMRAASFVRSRCCAESTWS